MYKTSNDRRFRRNKALLQRAFLEEVVELTKNLLRDHLPLVAYR